MRLHDLAHARAGDKGDTSDISVFARRPEHYAFLVEWLTAAVVRSHFAAGPVDRYEVPGLHALKFVLHGALHGGVTRSLALDIHGKSHSSILLQLEVPTTEGLA
ncbi:hypothetical protein [Amycolatopsis sp. NPDC098790]|uniref:AtuA-related protein n=1 Tax=Amycolatopsis sp. NPDC098790 TaxID=3363939 RepID=UPI0038241C32